MTSSRHSEDHISLNRINALLLFYISYVLVYPKNAIFYKKTMVYFNSFVIFPKLGLKPSNFCCSSKVLHRYRANIGKEHTTSTVGNDYYIIYGKYFCP